MKLPKLITGNKFICGLALAMLALFAAPAAHAQQTTCPSSGYSGNNPNWNLSASCTVNGNITPSAGDINFTMAAGTTLTINGNVNGPGGFGIGATGASATVNGTVEAATWIYVLADNGFTVQSYLKADNGNVQVYTSNGAINIGGLVTSTGGGNGVTMNGLSGVTLGSVNSAYQINLQTGTGTGTSNGTLKISGTAQSVGGAVFIAGQDVSLKGAVTNTGGWDVRVFANQSSAPTTDPFQIGASSPANGVLSINDSNTSGTGTIYITNGNGMGGITYSGNDVLQVNATGANAGVIVLDGQSTSNISLSGTLEANGSSGHSSGNLFFFAPAMTVTSATLNTNSPGQNIGGPAFTTNGIAISTSLTVSNNGNGAYPSGVNMSFFPVGAWSVNADSNLSDPITYGAFTGSSNPLAITGAGSLTINAIGNNNGVKIWGYPLTITPAAFTVNQQGSDDITTLGSWNGGSGYTTLTLGGTIAVHVNNNATGQTAGQIGVSATSLVQNSGTSGNILFDVSGYTGTAANGGTMYVEPSSGSLALGGTGNNITLKANGGSAGGNAGTITVGGGSVAFTVNNANAVQASALAGSSSNGGTINITGKSLTNDSGSSVAIAANGFGNGNGGTVDLQLGSGAVTFGTAATAFTVNANAATSGSGTGGTVTVKGGNVTITSPVATPAISVIAGNTNGTGGKITVNGSTISMSGGLSATGSGTKPGGVITITSTGNLTLTGTTAVALNASGNATGAPTDTAIIVTAHEAITIGTATGDVQLTAAGSGSSGNGGNVSVTTTSGAITAAGSAINVGPGSSSGNGGTITLNAKTTLTTSGTLTASGLGSGIGGTITLNGATLTVSGTTINANGAGTGVGGTVTLTQTGATTLTIGSTTPITAKGGNNGIININAAATMQIGSGVTIDVSSPGSNKGGTVNLAFAKSALGTFSLQGPVIATSATGNGGVVAVSTTDGTDISVASTGSIQASALATGSGGSISLKSATSDCTMEIHGNLLAKGGNVGGTITLGYSDTGNMLIDAPMVVADGGSLGGSITMTTTTSVNLQVTVNTTLSAQGGPLQGLIVFTPQSVSAKVVVTAQGLEGAIKSQAADVSITVTAQPPTFPVTISLITASNGNINIQSPSSEIVVQAIGQSTGAVVASKSVTMNGSMFNLALNTPTGDDFIQGSTGVSITEPSGSTGGDIQIGSDIVSELITLQTVGSGNILSKGGTIRGVNPSDVVSLTAITTQGNIGDLTNNSPLMTALTSAQLETAQSGPGSVNLKNNNPNSDGFELTSGSQSGGSFTVESSADMAVGSLTVGNTTTSSLQAVTLIADTGTLQVITAASIDAIRSTLTLQNKDASNGKIAINLGAALTATTTDTKAVGIFIFRGASATLNPGVQPANVIIAVTSPGFIDWGTADDTGESITALPATPTNAVSALKRPVVFDAKQDSTKIVLGGSTTINAQGN